MLKKIILPVAEKLQAGRVKGYKPQLEKSKERTVVLNGSSDKGKSLCQNSTQKARSGAVGKQGGAGIEREQLSRTQEYIEIKDMIQCLPSQQNQQTFH